MVAIPYSAQSLLLVAVKAEMVEQREQREALVAAAPQTQMLVVLEIRPQ